MFSVPSCVNFGSGDVPSLLYFLFYFPPNPLRPSLLVPSVGVLFTPFDFPRARAFTHVLLRGRKEEKRKRQGLLKLNPSASSRVPDLPDDARSRDTISEMERASASSDVAMSHRRRIYVTPTPSISLDPRSLVSIVALSCAASTRFTSVLIIDRSTFLLFFLDT